MFSAGLDAGQTIRLASLKILSDHCFLVTHCAVLSSLADISDAAFAVNIAIPDHLCLHAQELPENLTEMRWDRRGESYAVLPTAIFEKTLAPFHEQAISIQAVDIESDAMARALYQLCDITTPYFAILYSDNATLWLSVFQSPEQKKLFFHQEHLQTHNSAAIITRAFKLFYLQFPDIQIPSQACYIIGESLNMASDLEIGVVPDITQKLQFESPQQQQLFKADNTKWLLACGLSLWDKKSAWNLLPWRETEKRAKHKSLLKKAILLLISLGILGLLYFIYKNAPISKLPETPVKAVHIQTPQHTPAPIPACDPAILRPQKSSEALTQYPLSDLTMAGTIDNAGQLWAIIKTPDGHIYTATKGNPIGIGGSCVLQVDSKQIIIQQGKNNTTLKLS